ncbi:MAG: DUF3301 domain-containing protein [Rhodocyclaceae bacterium]|nr:DUF3301 domain-containing protein [Rhodocyclaceae bacterium]MCB1912693.1 DUF3301 domain-containing protein [Rhodocyclaceae bacterium]MCP5232584.1 DUF3301 domain-containing protein [Zoogloeaceae bacterium]MCP5238713.1 DUF3301 domain-containing protein [Zoogloeaceae bacterium]MCW5617174.1 DUF3301 domain-containing protein [Rhodocyclaceae bacterium]
MPTFELFIIAVLGLIAWFWLDTLRAREAGISAARQLCDKRNLQLLDDTVASESLRLARDDEGRVVLRRVYGFEFSDNGNNRRHGSVTLLGKRVVMLDVSENVLELVR